MEESSSSGSLLRLFTHPEFDSFLMLQYLHKYYDQEGTREFLINQMFVRLTDTETETYIPQILSLLCHRKPFSLSLERFVLDRCRRSMHLSLKLYWYLTSYVEDESPFNQEFCKELQQSCEMALVNGAAKGDDDILSESKDKIERSEYFSRVTSLVEQLMRISDRLRSVPVEDRPRQLQEKLGRAIQNIEESGGYLPLWSADSRHFKIVRLPPSEGVVLNSRDRCPYMVFLEVFQSSLNCSDTPNVHMSDGEIETLLANVNFESVAASPQGKLVPPSKDQKRALERWMEEESVELPTQPQPESWSERKERLRNSSPFGENPKWDLLSVIVKYGDDCRQELLAVQLLSQMKNIFDNSALPLYLHPHSILVVGKNAALIETIPNVKSIHQHKKANLKDPSLTALFSIWYGSDVLEEAYQKAQRNFVESLAGYSAAAYLLQFKDRHNGNLLIDGDAHIIHIDFGFMLGQSPGGIGFESAPFKLVQEWIDLMGGVDGDLFAYFQALLVKGFLELLKYRDKLVLLVEMMLFSKTAGKQPISCLASGPSVISALNGRFDSLGKTEEDVVKTVALLCAAALNSSATRLYDKFQYMTNGIEYL